MTAAFLLLAARVAAASEAPEAPSSSDPVRRCWAEALFQPEIDACAALELRESDAELNRTYRLVRARNVNRPRFLRSLRGAQHAWIRLRDADVAALWPEDEPHGSMLPACIALERARRTRERTAWLRGWLEEPADEGDACERSR